MYVKPGHDRSIGDRAERPPDDPFDRTMDLGQRYKMNGSPNGSQHQAAVRVPQRWSRGSVAYPVQPISSASPAIKNKINKGTIANAHGVESGSGTLVRRRIPYANTAIAGANSTRRRNQPGFLIRLKSKERPKS